MGLKIELVDLTFGSLKVIALETVDRWGQRRWRCLCVCGKEHVAAGGKLRSGVVTSCGCQKSRLCSEANIRHGDSARGAMSPEYRAWQNAIHRCENPRNKQYRDWGGRGIRVCRRWRESFAAFLADMGRKPSAEHTLDRFPDNDGNYEPGNCRWATRLEQRANRRPTKPRATWKAPPGPKKKKR